MKAQPILRALLAVPFVALSLASCGSGSESTTATPTETPAGDYFAYIGTYTATTSKGIHAFRFDSATGTMTPMGVVAETPNPAFLAVSPDNRFLYAVNWRGSDTVEGHTVSAYARDLATGQLTFLNKVSSQGEAPTHLAVDHNQKVLIVVNYDSGTMAALPIQEDGRLAEASYTQKYDGPSVHRQAGPHAHGVVYSPDNRFAFVADVGVDKVYTYDVDQTSGAIAPHDPPFVAVEPGRGPRHLAIHPNGRFLYANNESSSSVTAFEVTDGTPKELQTLSSLPADHSGNNSTAEIQIDPAGKFLYVSNRGHDSIAVFAVDQNTGMLTAVEHVLSQGKTPRNFSLDPTGQYLLAGNQGSDTLVQFRVDPATGRLTPTGLTLEIPTPSCVLFVKAE
jgi:6-phosphogluconolactonase